MGGAGDFVALNRPGGLSHRLRFDLDLSHRLLIVFPAGFLHRDPRVIGRGLHVAANVGRGSDAFQSRERERAVYLIAIVNRLLVVLLITTRTGTAGPVGAFMGI